MELIDSHINRKNLPIPNSVELFLTDVLPVDTHLVTSVFCLVFYKDHVLFTKEADIGHPDIDICGGHVEKGETLEDALYRELKEESGIIPDKIQLVGLRKYIISSPPETYPYPHTNYTLFYVGYIDEMIEGNEYALWMTTEEARKNISWVSENRILFEVLYQEVKVLRGDFEKTYLDVYDTTGKNIIDTKSYDQVHRQGLWHKGVHVWVLNTKGEFLIQKRSTFVQTYPNLYEASATGHIDQGKTSIETAIEESQEELGIVLKDKDFEYVGTIVDQFENLDGTVKNNEFDDVYIVRKDISLEEMTISKKEVSEILYIDAKEYLKKGINGDTTIVPRKDEYELLLKYLS